MPAHTHNTAPTRYIQARDTVEGMAADAGLFIDALGLQQFDVLAHSMGGEVAQVRTLNRPSLVRQLILYPDSGHGAHFQYPESFVTQARLFLDG